MREAGHAHPILVVAFKNKVFGLDRETGEIRWRSLVGTDNFSVVELLIDETTVIACSGTHLSFYDYLTGEERKSIRRKDEAKDSRPGVLLDNGQLFVSGRGTMACYSLTGDLLWEHGFPGEGFGETAIGLPHRVRQADHRGE